MQEPGSLQENNLPACVEVERELDRSQVRTADVLHEFRDQVKWEPDGRKFTVDISDDKSRAKFREMRRPYVRKAVEVQEQKQRFMDFVEMTTPTGERRQISEKIAAAVGRAKGFREASSLSSIRVLRTRVDDRHFCPDCDLRWAWCECGNE